MSEDITHARFKLPEAQVHATHPFKNEKNHKQLLQYVQQRLKLDMPNRDQRVMRYAQIDRDIAGFLQLSPEDQKRKLKHERTGSTQVTEMNLPLTWVHIDDMMTYYAQTFAPNRGMFYHTADPENSAEASQLVTIMNNHALYGGYYRQLLRGIFSILKYNLGGLTNVWSTDYGPKLEVDESGKAQLGDQVVFSGNKIQATDMYNLWFDGSVEPSKVYCDGEFFATAEVRSHYWLKTRCMNQTYFNCDDILNSGVDRKSVV